MNSLVAFESHSEKEKLREQRRKERNEILKKAEEDYNRREDRKKRSEAKGEGSWMLPSVDDRIMMEEKEMEKSLKRKKHKKEKKNKKKKHSHHDSDHSSSQSPVWVERTVVSDNTKEKCDVPKLERDSWMTEEIPLGFEVPKKEVIKPKVDVLDKLGQHRLELNPYWKDGGTGLPKTAPSASSYLQGASGDAGLSWLRKSLQRCKETAKEEGRSVEEVAAERFGSLQELMNRIAVAESHLQSAKPSSSRFLKPGADEVSCKESSVHRSSYKNPRESSWRKKPQDSLRQETKAQSPEKSPEKVHPVKEESDLSSDSSDSEDTASDVLTEEDVNKIGAQIIKAELLGDEALAKQLKAKLDKAQKMHKSLGRTAADSGKARGGQIKSQRDTESEVTLLTRTDRSGMTRPLKGHQAPVEHGRQKRKFESTHETSGKRTKFFGDDDKYSLKDLVEREKMSTAEDANAMFARLAGRHIQGEDEDMDDKMVDKAAMKQSASLMESREKQLAIIEHKKMSASLDKCGFCFQNVPKHLIVAVGVKVYLCLPKHRSMVEGHCFIVPIQHETQGTKCDEDIWDEIKIFRKGLTAMFKDMGKDCIFMETSMNLKRYPHAVIECIPVDKEIGDLAPIYFKKAIQECESEWAQNKKVIDLSQKDVRKAIPKGFPYFSVDFGSQGGYGHVIEDEKSFTSYFGREIVGGMLELDVTVWRRPHNEQFEEQRKKVLRFAEQWKQYDWTQRLK